MIFNLSVLVVIVIKLACVNAVCPDLVTKKQWGGLSPLRVQYLPRPVNLVIIQHTATPTCSTDEECKDIVQSIQNNHMKNLNFRDIGMNFLIGGNGKAYEGSGWLHVGAHTYGYNNRSIGISFIGNYNNDVPLQSQIETAQNLIQCGVEEGHLTPDYNLIKLVSLESPSRNLYAEMRNWHQNLNSVSSIKLKKTYTRILP